MAKININDLQGWIQPSPKQFAAIMDSLPIPVFADVHDAIKDTGKGKYLLLSDFFKALTGAYQFRVQKIGDCFISGTKVLMGDGSSKNIEDVVIGDEIVTHLNRVRKVTDTIKKQYNKNLKAIKAKGFNKEVVCTQEHQFVTYDRNRHNFDNSKWNWTEAKDLKEDKHCLLFPYGLQDNKVESFKFQNKTINLDHALSYLLGVYLAEGGCSGQVLKNGTKSWNKVTFNLNIKEELLADEILSIVNSIFEIEGKKYYHKESQNVLLVEFHNTELASFIKGIIPGNQWNKKVPSFILRAPKHMKLACLRGWLIGDGHNHKDTVKISGVSVSEELVDGFYTLATSCGLKASIGVRKARKQSKEAYSLSFYGDSATIVCEPVCKKTIKGKLSNITSLGIARKIEYIQDVKNDNCTVYCIEVDEDHSFIANGYATHNCVSFGAAYAVDHTYAAEIIYKKEPEIWVAETSTEDIYGGSRIQIGQGKLGTGDGSLGGWAAKYVTQYGTLIRQKYENDDLSVYDSNRAKNWGNPGVGVPKYLIEIAKEHRIRTTSLVTTYEQARDAIYNGYAVTVASNRGFNQKRDKDGFLTPTGTWGHQMCFIGVDDSSSRPALLCMNSWPMGWVTGPKRDDQPEGSFWVDAEVAERDMLSKQDSYAYSDRVGFPKKELDLYGII